MAGDSFKLAEGQTLRVVSSTPEALELEATWDPAGKPPPRHYHPKQAERFEVLEGELTVEVGKEPPRVLKAGDTLDVPPGTPHRMWNAGQATTRASWRVTPALRTEEMMRFIAEGMSPVRIAKLLTRYRDEYRLAVGR